MRQEWPSWDVVVIGGGPGGAAAGTLLAQHGHRVRILERSPGPRFHIGESLVPMTYGTFERLGMLDWLKASRFPRKYSVQFFTEDGTPTRPFYFTEHIAGEAAVTWQVWREELDARLLENAAAHGCQVDQGTQVTDVLFEGERAVGVQVRRDGGGPERIACQVVVDASGQSSIIANRLGLRVANPHLRQASIWTYFEGARRDPGIDAGATLILNTRGKHGWFWFIPLPDDVTSVGVVSAQPNLLGRGLDPETVYAEQVEACPALAARLAGARRVRQYHVTKDYTYLATQGAGDGWVLVGDAFGFLDPIYSTGFLLALRSGELAADAIHAGLVAGDVSRARIGAWEAEHRKAIERFRRLVYAFYSYEFSFGQFVRSYPQYRPRLVDLLVGDAYRADVDEFLDAIGDRLPYDGHPPNGEPAV